MGLEDIEKYIESVREEALKKTKYSGISLEFPYKTEGKYYLLPIRNSESCVVGAIKIFSIEFLEKILKEIDGKIDYIFLDAEEKNPEMKYSERKAKEIVKNSKVLTVKVNDFTSLSADLIISQIKSPIEKKKIVIVGAGNIGCKLAMKLSERSAKVFITGRNYQETERKAESMNCLLIKNSEKITAFPIENLDDFKDTDILVGFSRSSTASVTKEMTERTKEDALILDGGIGTIEEKAFEVDRNFIRLDTRAGFYGYIDAVIKTDEFIRRDIGMRTIEKNSFVAGGKIGKKGEIIVDAIKDTRKIIGIADGIGGMIRESLNNVEIDEEIKKKLMNPKFIFRVDGGSSDKSRPRNEQGMGHIARSLILADALREKEYESEFIMKNLPGAKQVMDKNYPVHILKDNNELEQVTSVLNNMNNVYLIIDKLDLSEEYVKAVKKYCRKVITIDNLGKGASYADINLYPLHEVPEKLKLNNRTFSGPEYIIMNGSFAKLGEKKKEIKDSVQNIVISMGGTDPSKTTLKIVEALKDFPNLLIKIVVGPGFIFKEEIYSKIKSLSNFSTIENLTDLSREIFEADLAIVSAGITPFEAAFLGTPCISISQNEGEANQILKNYKFSKYLGVADKVKSDDVKEAVKSLLNNKERRESMSASGKALFKINPKDLIMGLLLEK